MCGKDNQDTERAEVNMEQKVREDMDLQRFHKYTSGFSRKAKESAEH